MRRMSVALVVMLVACGGGDDEASLTCPAGTLERAGVCEPHGVGSCAEGFVADGEGGCRPVLPDEECAAGSIGTPGDRACRAIGVDSCAAGFSAKDGGCVASLPDKCDELELASLTSGCVPIAPCGDAKYAAESAPALYVDHSYAGSDADGSIDRPFAKLTDAIAAASTARHTILVTDGKYELSARLDKPVTIVGRCPDKVSLFTRESTPVLTNVADVTLRGLTITGFGTGVRIERGTTRIERCRIADTGAEGINAVRSGGAVTLIVDHSVVARAGSVGIAVEGATATLTETEIRSTKVMASGSGGMGLGLRRVGTTASDVTARSLVVSGSEYAGVYVSGSKLLLEASLVRDTAPGKGSSGYGVYGTALGIGPQIVVRDTQIVGTHGAGIGVLDGTATLERCTIEGGIAGSKEGEPYGGVVLGLDQKTKKAVRATITHSIIRNNQASGIAFIGASGEVASTIVRDIRSSGSEQTGCGARVVSSSNGPNVPEVSLHDVLIERAVNCGAAVSSGSVSFDRTVIRDIAPDLVSMRFGTGLTVFSPDPSRAPSVSMHGSVIERVHDAGVLSFGAHVELDATVIRALIQRAGGSYGHGIHLSADPASGTPSSGFVRRCLVAGTFEAGINVYQSSAIVEDTTVHGTLSTEGAFGDGITVGGIISKAGVPLLPWREASLVVRRSTIRNSARAAISVFEAHASLSNVLATCNGFDVNVESLPREDAQPFSLEDGGGNACGCGPLATCHASSANLAPLEAR